MFTQTQAKLIGSITLEGTYFYKGSSNCNLMICTMDDGTIEVFSQYGELMTTCTSVSGLATFLNELMNDRYA